MALFGIAIALANLAGGSTWPVWVGTLIAPLILGGWQIRQGNLSDLKLREQVERDLSSRNRELCEANILEALRQGMRIMAPSAPGTRSNLMLIDDDNRLFIAYHLNMADAPDHGVRLDKYQGCAGHAWALGEQAVADLESVPEGELRRSWKLTPDQIAMTSQIKSMICTPVRHPRHRDAIVGVFSLDSARPLAETGLDADETAEEALKVAEVLGRLLLTGGII